MVIKQNILFCLHSQLKNCQLFSDKLRLIDIKFLIIKIYFRSCRYLIYFLILFIIFLKKSKSFKYTVRNLFNVGGIKYRVLKKMFSSNTKNYI